MGKVKIAGVWVGGFLFVFAAILFWQSFSFDYYSQYGPGPGLFPFWLSGILMVLSILLIIESVRKNPIKWTDILPQGEGMKRVASIFVSLILFLIIVPYVGYAIASILMLFILFFGEFRWYWNLGLSIVVTLLMIVVFQVFLNVPLPSNSFGL